MSSSGPSLHWARRPDTIVHNKRARSQKISVVYGEQPEAVCLLSKFAHDEQALRKSVYDDTPGVNRARRTNPHPPPPTPSVAVESTCVDRHISND